MNSAIPGVANSVSANGTHHVTASKCPGLLPQRAPPKVEQRCAAFPIPGSDTVGKQNSALAVRMAERSACRARDLVRLPERTGWGSQAVARSRKNVKLKTPVATHVHKTQLRVIICCSSSGSPEMQLAFSQSRPRFGIQGGSHTIAKRQEHIVVYPSQEQRRKQQQLAACTARLSSSS